MYKDSLEGIVPRKKIRVRNYPESNNDDNFYLEVKISSIEGRFKVTKKIDEKYFIEIKKIGYFDENYGMCLPKINISYLRNYFKILDNRITIDYNISYVEYEKSSLIKKDDFIAVEIKANKKADLNNLYCDFPFQRVRFSKYCHGCILLDI